MSLINILSQLMTRRPYRWWSRRWFHPVVYNGYHICFVLLSMGKLLSKFIESLKNRLIIKQDFLMDWSLLRPHAKHPLLRDNLLYSNHIVVRLAINDLPCWILILEIGLLHRNRKHCHKPPLYATVSHTYSFRSPMFWFGLFGFYTYRKEVHHSLYARS